MPRGAPDDSDVQKLGIICRLDDMGELAARLGSPMLYHRFGDVVFMETFETGIARWRELYNGGTIAMGLNTDSSLSGGLSYLIDANATTACWAKIVHHNAPISTPKIGLHVAFFPDARSGDIEFGLSLYDGSYSYEFYIKYDFVTGKLYYWISGSTYGEIATYGSMYADFDTFHHMKMVIDYADKQFDKLYLDEELYDMSEYSPRKASSGTLPSIHIDIGVVLANGERLKLYLDDIILTQNEV